MNDDELHRLITGSGSDRVERKQSLSEPDRVREAICAFANDLPNSRLPGVIAIGVDDVGCPTGLPITDDLLLKLASFRDDGSLVPFPSLVVRCVTINGVDVAAVIVEPHSSPPVALRGRIWIRVGPRRALATPDDERRLIERRRTANLPFDSRPLDSASLDDLNLALFRSEILPQLVDPQVLAANHRDTPQQLAALRFADHTGRPTPGGPHRPAC